MLYRCLFHLVFITMLSCVCLSQTIGEIQLRRTWKTEGLKFDNVFPGARVSDIRRLTETRFLVVSRPEFRPINPSPWYAFDITAETARNIEVILSIDAANDFDNGFPPLLPSRPWLSHDRGVTWKQLDEKHWTRDEFTGTARVSLPAGTTRVAAFRPYTLEQVMEWCEEWAALPFVSSSTIGLSAEGRPLRQFTIAETDARRFLILMGGQHPPEGEGDRGLRWFAEELRVDTPLAREFRKHFQTIVIPMVNPDGKFHGHWRGTLGGKDPNRDWTDQTLPEVRTVARFLQDTCLAEGATVAAFVDFHATNRDFFYIAANDSPDDVSTFAARWFSRIAAEEGGHRPEAVASPNQAAGTSTAWARRVLNCPAYTREFTYNQDEQSIREKSRDESRALMRTLLADLGVSPDSK